MNKWKNKMLWIAPKVDNTWLGVQSAIQAMSAPTHHAGLSPVRLWYCLKKFDPFDKNENFYINYKLS